MLWRARTAFGLVRDYARGVIEAALKSGAQLQIDLSKVRPPYKSMWPKTIPSVGELETKYGWRQDKMPQAEWARLSIYDSVMGFGDFARYVIGTNSGSFEWLMTRLGKRRAITAKARYEAFLGKLNSRQRKAWEKVHKLQWQNAIAQLTKDFSNRSNHSGTNTRSKIATKSELRNAEKAFEATAQNHTESSYKVRVQNQVNTERQNQIFGGRGFSDLRGAFSKGFWNRARGRAHGRSAASPQYPT